MSEKRKTVEELTEELRKEMVEWTGPGLFSDEDIVFAFTSRPQLFDLLNDACREAYVNHAVSLGVSDESARVTWMFNRNLNRHNLERRVG